MNGVTQPNISFAEFEFDAAHRQLRRNGEPLAIYAKTFDLLEFLIEKNGQIVTKDEILEAVWEGQFVEEANLSVQVSALRKALGETRRAPRFLVTVPGKGYKFVAEIEHAGGEIIIEKRQISQLIVETETGIEDSKSTIQKFSLLNNSRRLALFSVGIFVLSGLIFGAYRYFQIKPTNSSFEKIKFTRLTNNGKIKAAAISPDGKFIAYALGENDGNSLWVRQIDAANDIRLVAPQKAEFWELTFTPDGKQIYYNLFSSDKPDAELFRIPTLGGVSQKVPKIIAFGISFSPDGKRFAYILPDSKGNNNHLVIADADGTSRQFIAQKSQPNTFVFDGDFAVWSPDGENIACLVNHLEANENYGSLVAVNVKDGTEKPLGAIKWQDVRGFEWLKDGSGLIVSGREKNSAKNQIWRMSLPSGEIRPVTDDLNDYSWISLDGAGGSMVALQTATVNSLYVGELDGKDENFKEIISEVSPVYPFVWTPDGKIIFQSAADGTANLWTMDADGANRRQLTTDAQVNERGMCLTPDGKYVVFTSWRSGKSNLWRVDADGQNLTQLTFGEADAHPDCTPDREAVVFQRGILSQPGLWKTSVSGGEPVKLTDFRAKWGAISNDGKQISFLQMKDDKWQICLIGADGGTISKRLDVPPIQRENTIRWSPDNRSLWFIGVNGNVGNIWTMPLDGSPPEQITNFNSHWLDDFSPSFDKKKFALARRLSVSDMILITNEKAQ